MNIDHCDGLQVVESPQGIIRNLEGGALYNMNASCSWNLLAPRTLPANRSINMIVSPWLSLVKSTTLTVADALAPTIAPGAFAGSDANERYRYIFNCDLIEYIAVKFIQVVTH